MAERLEDMPSGVRKRVLAQMAEQDGLLAQRKRRVTAPPGPEPAPRRWAMILPYPPTANTYYRNTPGGTKISKRGREYRRVVCSMVRGTIARPMTGRLAVNIAVYWPDNRRRDLDNLPKGLLDALQHGAVYENDSQIRSLHIFEAGYMTGGQVIVTVKHAEAPA